MLQSMGLQRVGHDLVTKPPQQPTFGGCGSRWIGFQSHFFFHLPPQSCTPQGPTWWLSGIEFTCNAGGVGDSSSIPGSGRFPGEGSGHPFQYSYWENPTHTEA